MKYILNFISELFDTSMKTSMIVARAQVLFILGIAISAVSTITWITYSFGKTQTMGVLALLVSPALFVFYVMIIRAFLECILAVFRIAENTNGLKQLDHLASEDEGKD